MLRKTRPGSKGRFPRDGGFRPATAFLRDQLQCGRRVFSESDAIPDEARRENLADHGFGLPTVPRRGGLKGRMLLWVVRRRRGTVKRIARKMPSRVHSCGCALPEAVRKASGST